MRVERDEIDLVDLVLILWNRRLIVIATIILATAAGICTSLVLPPIYSVSAILEPGRDAEGGLVESPQSIRETILGEAFNAPIMQELGLTVEEMLDFKVNIPKNTNLVKISVEAVSPQLGVDVLNSLLLKVSAQQEERLAFVVKQVEHQIETAKVKVQILSEQVKVLDSQSKAATLKMDGLKSSRQESMSAEDSGVLAALLHANELQNKQLYLDNLQMKRTALDAQRREAEFAVAAVELKRAIIKGVRVVKNPIVPEKPIKPKKTLIVVISSLLGCVGGVLLAFMAEFIVKVRQQRY